MLLALFGTPSITRAEPATSSEGVLAELELTADPKCATRTELVRRIQLRSDRIRFVTQTPGSRVLKARISPGRGATQRATLTLVQPGRGSLSRSVVARSCEEALDALALIAAVSLDPLASTEPVPEAVPAPGPNAGSGGSSGNQDLDSTAGKAATEARTKSGGNAAPAGGPEKPSAPAATPEPQEARAEASLTPPIPEPVPPSGAQRSAWQRPEVVIGLLGGALFGPAPELMPGASAFVALHWEDAELWAPALRVSVARHLRTGISEVGGTAEFSLDHVALEACPLRLLREPLSFRPCFAGSGGALYASGSETEAAADETRPWLTLGASALLFFEASEHVVLLARLSGGFPMIRDTFEFKPEPFHHVSPITLEASLGVGFRFP